MMQAECLIIYLIEKKISCDIPLSPFFRINLYDDSLLNQ
jgi:hypothetical protein